MNWWSNVFELKFRVDFDFWVDFDCCFEMGVVINELFIDGREVEEEEEQNPAY